MRNLASSVSLVLKKDLRSYYSKRSNEEKKNHSELLTSLRLATGKAKRAAANILTSNQQQTPFVTRGHGYGWTGRQSSSGFCDMPRLALGVFASLDRF